MIGMGSMTDPYIPLEKEIQNTRKALELICKYDFGATLITKSASVLRDLDILKEINKKTKCVIQMTLTTFDEKLCEIIEPNVSTTKERFEILKILNKNNIPAVVWLTPVLPFINDTKENLAGILDYCVKAKVYGVICFGMGVTLREGNREYFYEKLDKFFPAIKEKYIKTYGNNYILNSPDNKYLMNIFYKTCKQHNIVCDNNEIFQYLNTFESKTIKENRQLDLF